MSKETDAHNWLYKGRCYKLGHDVPHPGSVIPNALITAREFDPQKLKIGRAHV